MKKVIKFLSILFLVTLILAGCSDSDESNPKNTAKQFVKEIYTIDSKKIDNYNAWNKADDIESSKKALQAKDKTLITLMTKDGYNNFTTNRNNSILVQACAVGNYSMQVTNLTLSKNVYDAGEDKAGYNFEVKLKLISNKDKTEKTNEAKGYVALSKEDEHWKVFVYQVTLRPNVVEELLKNK